MYTLQFYTLSYNKREGFLIVIENTTSDRITVYQLHTIPYYLFSSKINTIFFEDTLTHRLSFLDIYYYKRMHLNMIGNYKNIYSTLLKCIR